MYTKEEIKSKLNDGVCKFVFTKKDGTERTMSGTTNLAFIPSEKHPKQIDESSPDYKPRKVAENTISVYDVDSDGWRSFIFDNLVEFDGERI